MLEHSMLKKHEESYKVRESLIHKWLRETLNYSDTWVIIESHVYPNFMMWERSNFGAFMECIRPLSSKSRSLKLQYQCLIRQFL